MAFRKHINALLRPLLDFFLPRRCVTCGKTNPDGEFDFICDDCLKNVHEIKSAVCLHCGEIIGFANTPNLPQCPKCADKTLYFKESLSICAFEGASREMLHALKYNNGVHYLCDISKIIRRNNRATNFLHNAILCPVPIYFSRRLKRRYNQAELIAKTLIKTFPDANLKIEKLLKRVSHSHTQTTLDRDAREKNIRNAFKFVERKTFESISRSTKIVIVDDVMTTGATLSECARILKAQGFKNIYAFSFARKM